MLYETIESEIDRKDNCNIANAAHSIHRSISITCLSRKFYLFIQKVNRKSQRLCQTYKFYYLNNFQFICFQSMLPFIQIIKIDSLKQELDQKQKQKTIKKR